MILSTLCYLERDESYLMLHRVSKKRDVNKDKWIGIGGKFERGESPEDCLLREAKEETGYSLTSVRLRGIVTFLFNDEEAEYIFLYTADGFFGTPIPCDEGTLQWVEKDKIDGLNLWEGDRIFFELIKRDAPFFSLKLHYRGDRLILAALDGKELELLDILGRDGEPTGLVRERSIIHRRGDFHRTSHVWIVREREDGAHELLLQKRSRTKDSFPGCLDISSAGHIPAGVGYEESALRELSEELGICATGADLCLIGFHEHNFCGQFYGEPFLDYARSAVYLYRKPVNEKTLALQKEEVEAVVWMDISEILLRLGRHEETFCLYLDEVEMIQRYLEG